MGTNQDYVTDEFVRIDGEYILIPAYVRDKHYNISEVSTNGSCTVNGHVITEDRKYK